MREILFRGKRIDNGEWVEGDICHHDGVVSYIGQHPADGSMVYFDLDPSTVCQYTGLTDKNGKKIFEGDILKRTNRNKYVWYVDYKNCAFCANQSNCNYACELGELLDQSELQIIGNVHDNPELLENP